MQSAQELNLASNKLSMGGSANLNLTGTLAQPVLLGRVSLTGGAGLLFGQALPSTKRHDRVCKSGPDGTGFERLYITTTVEQYNITLNLSGPMDRLRTNYTSEPSLPPADIVHLLAFGKTSEEAAAAPLIARQPWVLNRCWRKV